MVANQLPHLDQYQWIDFPTNGQIIIAEKLIENGNKVITGRLNLNFLNKDGVHGSLQGIKFRTGSFEN